MARKLLECENDISKKPFEVSYLFDINGVMLFRKNGSINAVKYSRKDTEIMHNNILTHNHPFQSDLEENNLINTSALSHVDLLMAYKNRLKECRMVIGNERHSLCWTSASKEVVEYLVNCIREFEYQCNEQTARVNKKLYEYGFGSVKDYYKAYHKIIIKYVTVIIKYLQDNQGDDFVFNKEDIC